MEINEAQAITELEDAYTALACQVGPLWGDLEEAELAHIASELRAAYDRHNVDAFDRIQGV